MLSTVGQEVGLALAANVIGVQSSWISITPIINEIKRPWRSSVLAARAATMLLLMRLCAIG
jgi:hypothetical protein